MFLTCTATARCWQRWLQTLGGYCQSCMLSSPVETSASAQASEWHMWVLVFIWQEETKIQVYSQLRPVHRTTGPVPPGWEVGVIVTGPVALVCPSTCAKQCTHCFSGNHNPAFSWLNWWFTEHAYFLILCISLLCSWHWNTDRAKTTRCALLHLLAVQWRTTKKKWVKFGDKSIDGCTGIYRCQYNPET